MSPQADMTEGAGNLHSYDSCEDRFSTLSQGDLDSISSQEVPVQLIAFIERPARDDPFSTWSMSDTAYTSVFPFQYIELVWLLRISALIEYLRRCVLMLIPEGFAVTEPTTRGIQNRMTGAHTINTGHDLYGIGAQFESSHA
ncbi:hypothetical protein BKA59DRAFT_507674 [Fusarium tricinctum]|uniref:Uncharacterized protein n=1 Tax=Fusarium tricinctum TaxID=61284 RepID=A0A8K0S8B2_9HYPO|nr:hypothetical protein BKA59DRAFT_507674 [Fusarium tricinctum]